MHLVNQKLRVFLVNLNCDFGIDQKLENIFGQYTLDFTTQAPNMFKLTKCTKNW